MRWGEKEVLREDTIYPEVGSALVKAIIHKILHILQFHMCIFDHVRVVCIDPENSSDSSESEVVVSESLKILKLLHILQMLLANQNPHPQPLSISWQRGEKLKDQKLKKSIRQQHLLQLFLLLAKLAAATRRQWQNWQTMIFAVFISSHHLAEL